MGHLYDKLGYRRIKLSTSRVEFLDSLSLLLGDDLLELDLALGSSLESSHQLAEFLVVIEVGSEC